MAHVLLALAHRPSKARGLSQGARCRSPGTRVEYQPGRHPPDLERLVERPVRIGDGGKGQSALELQHGFALRMEDDDFADPRRDDFRMALSDGAEVQIADWAGRIATELQV